MFTHIQTRRPVLLAAAFVALGLMAATANADTIYVCWDGSGDYLTIQEGIDAASDGDEVVVCDGTYTGPGNKDLDFHGKAITVRSGNGPDNCIIDCENDGRGFDFHSGETPDAIVDGFTIRNGYVTVDGPGSNLGGAVCCRESDPTIINCVITDNTASGGGALGGGVYCFASSPTIVDCTIVWNSAGNWGGGIYLNGCNLAIVGCVIAGNTALRGGGVGCWDSGTTVLNCTIAGNLATQSSYANHEGGGGIWVKDNSILTIANCAIVQNTTYSKGGGICCLWNHAGELTVANCTVSGNTAYDYNGDGDAGGGVRCSHAVITNCIMWHDWPQEIFTPYPDLVAVTYSDIERGWLGAGNIGVDPLFVDPDGPDQNPATWWDNDYHLSAGSPCIDAGCNGGVPRDSGDLDNDGDMDEITPLDLDGEGRFFDDPETPDTGCGFVPIVDMGAYEFGDAGPQPCPGDMDGDRDVDHSDLGILLSLWGATDECDLDCDGDIDQGDLGILLAHWGEGCP